MPQMAIFTLFSLAERVAHVAECTQCRPDLYHSYRLEGRGGGRMINYVGWAASPA